MAAKRWKGGAAAVASVHNLTVGGVPALNQVYTVTIGVRSLSYVATGTDTNNTIAAALQAILASSTYGEFLEVVWTVFNNVITGTANTAGVPFGPCVCTATGTGTFVEALSVGNSGPNDVSIPANWDTGTVPVATDDVYIDHSNIDCLWNLQTFNGVAFNSLTISSTFQAGQEGNGTLGLPEVNTNGTLYVEYRQQFLQCSPATCTIGDGVGNGSGRIKLDFGTGQFNLIVHGTGAAIEPNLESLLIKGTNAANVASVNSGSVAFAAFGDDSAILATLNTGSSSNGPPQIRCGKGCTVTTLNMEDGTVLVENAPTTINKNGGTLTVLGGNVATWNEYGGGSAYLGTGTITTLTGWAVVDFSQDSRSRTVTNATFYPGGGFSDPMATVTWTNPFQVNARLADVSFDWGRNRHVTLV